MYSKANVKTIASLFYDSVDTASTTRTSLTYLAFCKANILTPGIQVRRQGGQYPQSGKAIYVLQSSIYPWDRPFCISQQLNYSSASFQTDRPAFSIPQSTVNS